MDDRSSGGNNNSHSRGRGAKVKKKREKEQKWTPIDTNFSMPVREQAASSSGAMAGSQAGDMGFTMDDFAAYAAAVSEADSYGVPPPWIQQQQQGAFGQIDQHQQHVMASLGLNFDQMPFDAMAMQDEMMMVAAGFGVPPPPLPSIDQILSAPLNPDAKPFVPPNQPPPAQDNNSQRSAAGGGRNRTRTRKEKKVINADDFDSMRERLVEELEQESYECMICYQSVMRFHWVWSCDKCFHIFHFHRRIEFSCISKWINKSMEENVDGWRCPGCQNVNLTKPTEYRCFCGKQVTPKTRRGDTTPHCCSDICGKQRAAGCPHPCNLQCHPGPCAPCARTVTLACDCGKESKPVRCGSVQSYKCGKLCGALLSCGKHKCELTCHEGPCSDCSHLVEQHCFCGGASRQVRCAAGVAAEEQYSCGQPCPRQYDCDQHTCRRLCHADPCGVCPLRPESVSTCPCGKTPLDELQSSDARQECTDPIPLCKLTCGKLLNCGPKDSPHKCASDCHEGECPTCDRVTYVQCRCAQTAVPVPCSDIPLSGAFPVVLCERKCKRTKSCKQHKCLQPCCIDQEHLCMMICGRKLSCGNHTCDRLCHNGRCASCLQSSFTELMCRCGSTVQHPPVPCGTPRPVCDQPCNRQHRCAHPVTHNCHDDDTCPPCTFLVSKWCHGGHELRCNIPCHLQGVSCGRACRKPLSCGRHSCIRICHPDDCEKEGEPCRQLCQTQRPKCGHPCAQPCHESSETACAQRGCAVQVHVSCKCGRRTDRLSCAEVDKQWDKTVAHINQHVQQMQAQGGAVQILESGLDSLDKYRSLVCDEECARVARNKQLQRALQVQADDTPVLASYTEYLKTQLRVMPSFILQCEKDFTELVNKLTATRQQRANISFESMDRDRRRVIHEYAAYFQIETTSYDAEPQRNVVATAVRGLSRPPTPLLSSLSADRRVAAASNNAAQTSNSPAAAGMVSLSGFNVDAARRRLPPTQ